MPYRGWQGSALTRDGNIPRPRPARGQPEPPVIVVLRAADGPQLREVLAGIEEEGVPYSVQWPPRINTEAASATGLARQAALRSPLHVGVGVGAAGDVCVHHDKLSEPLSELCSDGAADRDVARTLGHNAARIVVSLPLKPMPRTPILSFG
ncbi:glycerol dehydratase reactivase beta/small subunit family protein [Mycolicibacterium sp. 624]|uniref:glycerol dehydratase reactivase beta/small subunit family protein n=1 Tax=Mycolicibacterium sp. 624 TaxID=3156314 RepID=UPI003396CC85